MAIIKFCKKCGRQIADNTGGTKTKCDDCLANEILSTWPENYEGEENSKFHNNVGWVCPKCGSVMSPWQNTCVKCTTFNHEITC